MKTTCRLGLLMILLLNISFFACKKKYDPPKPFSIEYKIVPMNNSFTSLWFYGDPGNYPQVPIYLGGQDIPADGSIKIVIFSKPFLAKISTEVNNKTNTNIIYDLMILVDGQIKKTVSVIAPPMTASSVATAEYIVQ